MVWKLTCGLLVSFSTFFFVDFHLSLLMTTKSFMTPSLTGITSFGLNSVGGCGLCLILDVFRFLKPWWDEISDQAKDLVSHLLCTDPDVRFTPKQVSFLGFSPPCLFGF
jgi:hypothetical protein